MQLALCACLEYVRFGLHAIENTHAGEKPNKLIHTEVSYTRGLAVPLVFDMQVVAPDWLRTVQPDEMMLLGVKWGRQITCYIYKMVVSWKKVDQ